jgi:transcriptional regulator with XRE-family HTH domain
LTSTVPAANEALGSRLREIRKDAGLSGRALAALAGWHFTKVSKIELGRQNPSDADIRTWCGHCHAEDQVADLIATLRNIESQYIEWRRTFRAGTKRRQEVQRHWEHEARLIRIYEPLLIPGILHTAAYATKIVQTAVSFYGIPDDVTQSVDTRLTRQDALYTGIRRFHIIVEEQALHTRLGDVEVLQGQLGRVLEASTLPRLRLGIIPSAAVHNVWPIHGFWLFDERMVRVETYTAELTVTQPREIALYAKAFEGLAGSAVYGREARTLITHALQELSDLPRHGA